MVTCIQLGGRTIRFQVLPHLPTQISSPHPELQLHPRTSEFEVGFQPRIVRDRYPCRRAPTDNSTRTHSSTHIRQNAASSCRPWNTSSTLRKTLENQLSRARRFLLSISTPTRRTSACLNSVHNGDGFLYSCRVLWWSHSSLVPRPLCPLRIVVAVYSSVGWWIGDRSGLICTYLPIHQS